MNPPEFRLLGIWQSVVEIKKPRLKMFAYRKIASQVGISDRSVRENIKKLVEQGYLVEADNWYALNFDSDFIKYIVKISTEFDIQTTGYAKPSMPMPSASKTSPFAFGLDDAETVCYSKKTEVLRTDIPGETQEREIATPKKRLTIFPTKSTRTLSYHSVSPSRRVEIAQESISKFRQMFGDEAEMAMDFFKKQVLKKH